VVDLDMAKEKNEDFGVASLFAVVAAAFAEALLDSKPFFFLHSRIL